MPFEEAQTTVVQSKLTDMMPADLFTRTIALVGPLDHRQREKIHVIADLCPVDLTLVRGSDIRSRLLETDTLGRTQSAIAKRAES